MTKKQDTTSEASRKAEEWTRAQERIGLWLKGGGKPYIIGKTKVTPPKSAERNGDLTDTALEEIGDAAVDGWRKAYEKQGSADPQLEAARALANWRKRQKNRREAGQRIEADTESVEESQSLEGSPDELLEASEALRTRVGAEARPIPTARLTVRNMTGEPMTLKDIKRVTLDDLEETELRLAIGALADRWSIASGRTKKKADLDMAHVLCALADRQFDKVSEFANKARAHFKANNRGPGKSASRDFAIERLRRGCVGQLATEEAQIQMARNIVALLRVNPVLMLDLTHDAMSPLSPTAAASAANAQEIVKATLRDSFFAEKDESGRARAVMRALGCSEEKARNLFAAVGMKKTRARSRAANK